MARSGQKADAYLQLKSLQRQYPQDVKLLLWIAFTSPSLEEAQHSISLANNLESGSPQVQQAKEWLATELSRQPLAQPSYSPIQTSTQLSISQSQSSLPQMYDSQLVYAPLVNQSYAPPLPYTVQVKSLKNPLPRWAFVAGGLATLLVVVLLTFFLLVPPKNAESNFIVYSSPEDLFHNTGVGQQVKFYGRLEIIQRQDYDGYAYYGWYTLPNVPPRVMVRFLKNAKLAPAVGNATYYVKILDRRVDAVIADIEKIES